MERGRARGIAIAIACVAVVSAGCSKSSNGSGTTGPTGAGATGTTGAGTTGASGASGAATGATGSSPSAPPVTGGGATALAGTWTGTWQNLSPAPASGTFVIKWTATGSDALTGTIDVSGAGCVSNGKIAAALQGGKISFGVVQGQASVTYTGSVSGDTMSGTYAASATCADAKGNWKATKTG
ncbi:MAG: hypothetical protein ACXVEI_05320 [Actinomycetota bacterium]